jgi:hypothetical protein
MVICAIEPDEEGSISLIAAVVVVVVVVVVSSHGVDLGRNNSTVNSDFVCAGLSLAYIIPTLGQA